MSSPPPASSSTTFLDFSPPTTTSNSNTSRNTNANTGAYTGSSSSAREGPSVGPALHGNYSSKVPFLPGPRVSSYGGGAFGNGGGANGSVGGGPGGRSTGNPRPISHSHIGSSADITGPSSSSSSRDRSTSRGTRPLAFAFTRPDSIPNASLVEQYDSPPSTFDPRQLHWSTMSPPLASGFPSIPSPTPVSARTHQFEPSFSADGMFVDPSEDQQALSANPPRRPGNQHSAPSSNRNTGPVPLKRAASSELQPRTKSSGNTLGPGGPIGRAVSISNAEEDNCVFGNAIGSPYPEGIGNGNGNGNADPVEMEVDELSPREREKAYKAMKTGKACDVCKIRKVKCNGCEPCASCILHDSVCAYSKVTRKSLLSRAGTATSATDGTKGIGTSNKRTNFGSEVNMDLNSTAGPGTSSSGEAGMTPASISASMSRFGSASPFESPFGSGSHTGFGPQGRSGFAFGLGDVEGRFDEEGDQAGIGVQSYAMDEDREGERGNSRTLGDMQGVSTSIPHGLDSRRRGPMSPGRPPSATDFAYSSEAPGDGTGTLTRSTSNEDRNQPSHSSTNLEGRPPTKERMDKTPGYRVHEGNTTWGKADSAGQMQNLFGDASFASDSRNQTWPDQKASVPGIGGSYKNQRSESTPQAADYSDHSGWVPFPGLPDEEPKGAKPNNRRTDLGGESNQVNERSTYFPINTTTTNDVRHARLSEDEQANVSSGKPTFSKQYGVGKAGLADDDIPRRKNAPPLTRSYGQSQPVIGAECDIYGNAGITTCQPASDSGMQWWGPTSFVTWQDRLSRLLDAVDGSNQPESGERSTIGLDGVDTASTGMWRWGASDLFFRTIAKPRPQPRFDAMFLPATLAHRFFWSYCTILHPMWPILDLDEVRESIATAYAGGVTYQHPFSTSASAVSQEMSVARNLIVLALGARIEGGDGDAHCPKDVAKAWAVTLSSRSKEILMRIGLNSVSMEASKLWLLHSLDLTNHGYADETYMTIGNAARQMLALGYHREATATLPGAASFGCRMTFWSCFVMEKFTSLWAGRPSCLNIATECDLLLPEIEHARTGAMNTMVQFARLADKLALMYSSRQVRSNPESALRDAQAILGELKRILDDLSPRFEGFHRPVSSQDCIDLDTQEGEVSLLRFNLSLHYHNLRMLAATPVLSLATWDKLNRQGPPRIIDGEIEAVASNCVESALATVQACHVYFDLVPYLPFMGSFSNHLLYAVPILYFDIVVRSKAEAAPSIDVESLVDASRCLEQMDHPASEICKAMLRECFDNHISDRSGKLMSISSEPRLSPAPEVTTWTGAAQ